MLLLRLLRLLGLLGLLRLLLLLLLPTLLLLLLALFLVRLLELAIPGVGQLFLGCSLALFHVGLSTRQPGDSVLGKRASIVRR
jgi:hypothetical protein